MVRLLILLSFVFTVIIFSIDARSVEHHVRTRAVCPAGLCLSKFGYCGVGDQYCSDGCQSGPCYLNSCPAGMCLSMHGYCGTDDAYCGVGCQAGPCRGGTFTTEPSVVTATLPSVTVSGRCAAGLCLSKFGYCGVGDQYCGDGCQSGPCYNNPCPAGMCLSMHGYCGTDDAYCSAGCQAGPCRGTFTTEPTVAFSTEPTVTFSTEPTVVFSTEPTVAFSTYSYVGSSIPSK